MDTDKLMAMIQKDCDLRTTVKDGNKYINCVGCRWESLCGQDMYYMNATDILKEFVRIANESE